MAKTANISLIGMPGVGKSTVGILLAKSLSWSFVDTDILIQVAEERRIREIIRSEGIEAFLRIEQRHIAALDRREHVIAAGGSVVYSRAAMARLRSLGAVVHLDLPLPLLEDRLYRLNGNGIVVAPGQTLHGVYQQRYPLYQKHATVTIDCASRSHEQIVQEIVSSVFV